MENFKKTVSKKEKKYKLQMISDRLILSNKFGELVFRSTEITSHSKKRFSFYIDSLYACVEEPNEIIAEFFYNGEKRVAIARIDNALVFFFNPIKLILSHILQRCLSQKKFSYLNIPYISFVYDLTSAEIHFFLYRMISYYSKLKNWNIRLPYLEWPTDLSLFTLLELLKQCDISSDMFNIYTGPWPSNSKSVVCLSHDVDDFDGYKNMDRLLNIERQFNFRATYNIPGARYPVNIDYLYSLEQEGFEFGIHGYKHQGKIPFMSEKEIVERMRKSIDRFEGIRIRGYRSPALRRTVTLLKVLEKFFNYDSSVPDTENFVLGHNFNGCSIPYPFFVRKMLEIPITVPQDGVLLMLGYSPDEILSLWKKKVTLLKQLGALIVINTHPDPIFSGNSRMEKIYRKLLEFIALDSELYVTTLGSLDKWVRNKKKL